MGSGGNKDKGPQTHLVVVEEEEEEWG